MRGKEGTVFAPDQFLLGGKEKGGVNQKKKKEKERPSVASSVQRAAKRGLKKISPYG